MNIKGSFKCQGKTWEEYLKMDAEEKKFQQFRAEQKAFVHYCPDWDFMAIHKDMPEFEACLCKGVPNGPVKT